LWRTYRAIVRAAIFGFFLPAFGFVWLPQRIRLVFWVVLVVLPFGISSQTIPLLAVVFIVMLSFAAITHGFEPGSRYEGEKAESVRLSWMNVFVTCGIGIEAILLLDAPQLLLFLNGPTPPMLVPNIQLLPAVQIIAVGISIVWLLIVALPFALSDADATDGQACRRSERYHIRFNFFGTAA
jgi:hypothetical protein